MNPIPQASCSSSGVYRLLLVVVCIFWRLLGVVTWLLLAKLIFEVTKLTGGNFAKPSDRQNFLNLFRNDSECFKILKMSTIAGATILKRMRMSENVCPFRLLVRLIVHLKFSCEIECRFSRNTLNTRSTHGKQMTTSVPWILREFGESLLCRANHFFLSRRTFKCFNTEFKRAKVSFQLSFGTISNKDSMGSH